MFLRQRPSTDPVPLLSDSDSGTSSTSSSSKLATVHLPMRQMVSAFDNPVTVSRARDRRAGVGEQQRHGNSQALSCTTGAVAPVISSLEAETAASSCLVREDCTMLEGANCFSGLPTPDGSARCRGLRIQCESHRQESLVGCDHQVMRVLVVGAPQVGKSSLINYYRAAVTNGTKWPAAPVGICGYHGTVTVDPFPDSAVEPSWLCIDTPGKFYDDKELPLLSHLLDGLPWKTKLLGEGGVASSLERLEELSAAPENKAHQCIIVCPATDLVRDHGWVAALQLKSRYESAPDANGAVSALRKIVAFVRSYFNGQPPFVVVTKMDLVGGAGNGAARRIIFHHLSYCVPVNRVYLCACPDDGPFCGVSGRTLLDQDTRMSLLKMHKDISSAFFWQASMHQYEKSLSF
ncbi:hypothetical protein ERJ75_001745100 [Trypanosoma vivax]|uniref:Uncharacterized protein n=1 Tax=Trypanosoma vivax (strain Y486) TaxID=1055687 RepID=G0U2Q6_TRYVY|nr:hypothetical protein TRVL_05656 [Trypanosoma vivax]KAH8604354.1 hypothetical protein ERJ75_001745100 [Trypanosoma vivax]CCC50560.1 conserved hypothetical protein [Trypanosoma vivax Y486]